MPALSLQTINSAFSAQGALAKSIEGFTPRPAQQRLAEAVADTIASRGKLLVEAGTGTGKTFAYLVPALLSKQKVILSTGTRALQEQLYYRDLPKIRAALGSPRTLALLKGRANYLCLHRLELSLSGGHNLGETLWQQLYQIQQWSLRTDNGDIGAVEQVPDDSPVWPLVTSTVDNCQAKKCPRLTECWVRKAREAAQSADLVVINHHLFFADMALRDTGFGELLPQADVFIFDEAHQLPDIAGDYFGEHLSSRQVYDLVRDVQFEYSRTLVDMRQLNVQAERCQSATREVQLQLATLPDRGEWPPSGRQQELHRGIDRLQTELVQLAKVLKLALGRSELIDHCYERCASLLGKLGPFVEPAPSAEFSFWYESGRKHFSLHSSPLSVATQFSDYVSARPSSWILTSATLAMGDDFSVFAQRLGLNHASQLLLPSPFDYENQALLCVPRHLPPPNAAGRIPLILERLLPLIQASGGRCFLLFTSQRAMGEAGDWLRAHWPGPLLVQGQQGKRQLLRRFVAETGALLLGLASFWEGVDVQGGALSCVIIDKLPFAAPDDPLLKARMAACRRQQQDPFTTLQLPQAVMSLKQGAGRLIRGQADHGVLVIADPRLVAKAYGRDFLRSLPPMPRTRSVDRACAVLASMITDRVQQQRISDNELGELGHDDDTIAGD